MKYIILQTLSHGLEQVLPNFHVPVHHLDVVKMQIVSRGLEWGLKAAFVTGYQMAAMPCCWSSDHSVSNKGSVSGSRVFSDVMTDPSYLHGCGEDEDLTRSWMWTSFANKTWGVLTVFTLIITCDGAMNSVQLRPKGLSEEPNSLFILVLLDVFWKGPCTKLYLMTLDTACQLMLGFQETPSQFWALTRPCPSA